MELKLRKIKSFAFGLKYKRNVLLIVLSSYVFQRNQIESYNGEPRVENTKRIYTTNIMERTSFQNFAENSVFEVDRNFNIRGALSNDFQNDDRTHPKKKHEFSMVQRSLKSQGQR